MKNSPASSGAVPVCLKWSLVALALALVIGLGISTVFRAAYVRIERTDFTVYRAAGQAVLGGTDIYQAHNSRGWAYVYPPPFAIVMAPFAKLSVFWGALIWYAISVVLFALIVVISARLTGGTGDRERESWWLYVVPILPVLGWFVSAVTRGQASIMVSSLVIAAIFWHFRGRNVLGGVCLAGAVLLKVFPALLLAYFVWRKRWRFVAASLLALLVGALLLPAAVFGWQRNIDYLHEWVSVVARPALAEKETRAQSYLNEQLLDPQKPRNQSLAAVIWRVTASPRAREIAAGLIVLMALATIWTARRARADSELLIVSAAMAWMLLAPPVSESHYFVLLLLPLAVLTVEAQAAAEGSARRLARVTLVLYGVAGLVAVSEISTQVYGLLCWATVGLWASFVKLTASRPRR